MASGLFNTESARLLASSLNGTAYPLTTGSFVALLTSGSSGSTSGAEVSGGSYSRQGPSAFTINGNVATNASAVNFTGMPACTVTSQKTTDASTGGNNRWYGDLGAARTVAAGDTISFSPGSLAIQLLPTS